MVGAMEANYGGANCVTCGQTKSLQYQMWLGKVGVASMSTPGSH